MNEVNLVKNLNLLNVSNQQLSISDNLVVNAALDGKVHCVDFASRFERKPPLRTPDTLFP